MSSFLSLKATQADGFWRSHDHVEKDKKERKPFNPDKPTNVRFEAPFNLRCNKCENRIAKGTRYDAIKQRIGNYLSTPVFQFEFLCVHVSQSKDDHKEAGWEEHRGKKRRITSYCDNKILLVTNPKESTYEVTLGAKRADLSTERGEKDAMLAKDDRKTSAMHALEKQKGDESLKKERDILTAKFHERAELRKDDYDLNCKLRENWRIHKKQIRESEGSFFAFEEPKYRCPALENLKNECIEDIELAKTVAFARNKQPMVEPIFGKRAKLQAYLT